VPIHALLSELISRNASDLHLTVGSPPMFRVDGSLVPATGATVLDPTAVQTLTYGILTEQQRLRFETAHELDFSFTVPNLARFRGNCFRQRGHVALVLKHIPITIKSVTDLHLPPAIVDLTERPRGLVLVTGPTGAGKSTTLAALIDKINRERRGHILTVEDPIEFVHESRGCIVNQREVGTDTNTFADALKYALREDPDVVLIGEMRDLETIHAGLTIAETGHLAFATLHTNSAVTAINRIIDVYPSHQQSQVRVQLSFVLEGIVTQTLLPRRSGSGRVMAAEILIITPAIRALIRDDKVHQIYSMIQSGRKHGMQTLNEALFQLWTAREVAEEDCVRVSNDPVDLLRMMGKSPSVTHASARS
jgi:twitching motility protein PilT